MDSIGYHLKVMVLAAFGSVGSVALGILLAWFIVNPAPAAVRVDNAIVLIADVSSSMKEDERQLVRQSHAEAVSSPEVWGAVRSGAYRRVAFAYVEFSNTAEVVVDWTMIDSHAAAQAFANSILSAERNHVGTQTAIGEALVVAHDLFGVLPWEPLFRTVDVAGDGKNNNGVHPSVPRQNLLDLGATINGMPMTRGTQEANLTDYYANEVSGGPRSFVIELRDIAEMPMLMRRKLVMELF